MLTLLPFVHAAERVPAHYPHLIKLGLCGTTRMWGTSLRLLRAFVHATHWRLDLATSRNTEYHVLTLLDALSVLPGLCGLTLSLPDSLDSLASPTAVVHGLTQITDLDLRLGSIRHGTGAASLGAPAPDQADCRLTAACDTTSATATSRFAALGGTSWSTPYKSRIPAPAAATPVAVASRHRQVRGRLYVHPHRDWQFEFLSQV